MGTVSFTRMAAGSAEDYLLLAELEKQHASGVADRVLGHLRGLESSFGGYQVDRLEHSLQCASRAHRAGASEELVVVALLHDIGDMLAPLNHSEMAAAILRPYVSEEAYWRSPVAWVLPNLLLRASFGRRPERSGEISRPPVLRRHCQVLRRVGPAGIRPPVRYHAI